MNSNSPFLTAQWRNLINITYAIPPNLLLPYLPKGVDLDIQDGNAFVSLVAFDFIDTRVKGWYVPFHTHFPEINLRFYVKYGQDRKERAVCFIREYVPKRCIAWVAKSLYNEPYYAIPMLSSSTLGNGLLTVTHQFKVNGCWYNIEVRAHHQPFIPSDNSIEHYFKEHDIGFGIDRKGNTLSYHVEHTVWAIYPIDDYKLTVDFGKIYGRQWTILNELTPIQVVLAEGSPIKVYPPTLYAY